METQRDTPFRWGVLGAAVIARKFWQAVRLSGSSELAGIASRSVERSHDFVRECQSRFPVEHAPRVFDSYADLIQSHDIDGVYVPLPTGVREQWVVAAAKQGKHVLCEKPCAVSNEALLRMIQACKTAGVQFMDNVMFMHSARMQRLRNLLYQEQGVGEVRRIATQFSFLGDQGFFSANIRNQYDLEPWGCLGDLGWYCIRVILLAMNDVMPTHVRGRVLQPTDGSGPPSEFTGELFFPDGASASIYCSFLNQHQQWVHVSGTDGSVLVEDFVLPCFGNQLSIRQRQAVFNESGFDFNYECRHSEIRVDEYGNGHRSAQEVSLIRNFVNLARSAAPDSYWPTISYQTQSIMQALWESAKADRQVDLA